MDKVLVLFVVKIWIWCMWKICVDRYGIIFVGIFGKISDICIYIYYE